MKNSYESFLSAKFKSRKHSSYFAVYDDIVGPYVDRAITFVEVGVLGGGSLFMWRDYLGESARIIGIDFNPNAKKWEKDGFEIFIGNQADEEFWDEFFDVVGKVDVILDDGGHTYEQQTVTLHKSLPHVNDGGVVIVEDVHTSYMQEFGRKKYNFVNLSFENVNRLNRRFFGKHDKQGISKLIWKIDFYESIVAYHVDRRKSEVPEELHNSGADDEAAIDYRYSDDYVGRRVSKMTRWLGKFLNPHFSQKIGDFILYLKNSSKVKKYRKFFYS